MKSFFKNPLFCIALFLSFVLVFEIISIAQAGWSGPTAPPPNGQPELPIDQGEKPEYKIGPLELRENLDVWGNFSLGKEQIPGSKLIIKEPSQLCFGTTNCISSWDELSKKGVSLWSLKDGTNDIYYTDGNVGIGTNNPKPYKLNIVGGGIGVTGASYFGNWVGIGTSEPPAIGIKLNVNGSGYFDDDLIVKGNAAFFQPVIVGTPIGPDHAATKSYVDALPGSTGDITSIITSADNGLTGGADEGDVTLKVNFGVVQKRVTKICDEGQAIRFIKESGDAECQDVGGGGGGGNITAITVTAGSGLTGGGTNGDVNLNTDLTVLQKRVSGTCESGKSIRVIKQDGTVECETDDVGAGGGIGGSGSANYIPKWKDAATLQNSIIYESADKVGIGVGNLPNTILDIAGAFSVRGTSAPSVSPAGEGRIYFDSVSKTFKVSENSKPYANLLGGGGGESLWKTGASEEIGLVDTNKKVEIGNVSSSYKLSVAGSGGGSAYFEGIGYFAGKLKADSFELVDGSVYLGQKDANGLSLRVPGSIQSSGDKPNYFGGNVNIGGVIQSSGSASNYFAGKVGIGGASGPRGILDVQGGSDIYLEPSGNIYLTPQKGIVSIDSYNQPLSLNVKGDINIMSVAQKIPPEYIETHTYYSSYEPIGTEVQSGFKEVYAGTPQFSWWQTEFPTEFQGKTWDNIRMTQVRTTVSPSVNGACEDSSMSILHCPASRIYDASNTTVPQYLYDFYMYEGPSIIGQPPTTFALAYQKFQRIDKDIIDLVTIPGSTYNTGGGISAKKIITEEGTIGELTVSESISAKEICFWTGGCKTSWPSDTGAASGWTYAPASQIIYAADPNAKVGIGINAPTEGKLQIKGEGSSDGLTLENNKNSRGKFWIGSDNSLYITRTAIDEAPFDGIVMTGSGLGIGIWPNTGNKLDVGGNMQVRGSQGIKVGDGTGVQGYVIVGFGLQKGGGGDCKEPKGKMVDDGGKCECDFGTLSSDFWNFPSTDYITKLCVYPKP